MSTFDRRKFLRNSGLGALPFLMPPLLSRPAAQGRPANAAEAGIHFITDMPLRTPEEYLSDLQAAVGGKEKMQDFYADGGAVKALEEKFAALTGKEMALFLPTGTLANNLAVRMLSGSRAKVFVQETSHLYRDEADAAQSVHGKRLLPLAPGKGAFTLEELEQSIAYHKTGEVFASPPGAVSIETPVRRVDNYVFPFDEMKKITDHCRQQGIRTHLDGARLHIAAAWSGKSVRQYADLFNTVYISLYKYLGSPGGAILCGDKATLEPMKHWIKVMGGSVFQAWPFAAIALRRLDGIDAMWQQARTKGEDLFRCLAATGLVEVKTFEQGSNVHQLHLKKKVDYNKLTTYLDKEHSIRLRTPGPQGFIRLFVNETLLWRENEEIVYAIADAVKRSS